MPKRRRIAIMLDLDWPYKRHSALFAGTQEYGQEHGWESIIDEYVDDTLANHHDGPVPYDGIIARASKRLADSAAKLKIPIVNVWQSSPAAKTLPGVFPDFSASGRLRAEHLLSRGFRNFASLIANGTSGQDHEESEFRRVLKEAGFTCLKGKQIPLRSSQSVKSWRKCEQAISEWMDAWEPPIGVYVGPDRVGRFVAQLCQERGWRVPEDVAITAGWNELTICENPRPSLTSVELGYERIGYEAAALLDRLISSDKRNIRKAKDPPAPISAPEQILLPPQALVVRESTDFFAVKDKLVASAIEFIAANCHKPISPNDVATAVNMELRTLQRRFRKFIDRPIATEIRRVRIERAKRELTQTDRSVKAISRDVGFGEPMRMYEIFQRELGVTPSDYRKHRRMEGGT